MKIKQIISLIMLSAIVLGSLTGCGTDSLPETPPAATLLSAEEDARLKEELQKDIDAILNTETAIVHSDTYIPGETYTGTAYYVSADGDDNNDGLSPETAWQTVEKVGQESTEGGILQFGDAVFFRRGDLFLPLIMILVQTRSLAALVASPTQPMVKVQSRLSQALPKMAQAQKNGSLSMRMKTAQKSGSSITI